MGAAERTTDLPCRVAALAERVYRLRCELEDEEGETFYVVADLCRLEDDLLALAKRLEGGAA